MFRESERTNYHTIKMNRKLVGKKGAWAPQSDPISAAVPGFRRRGDVRPPAHTVLLFDGRCEDTSTVAHKTWYDGWEPYTCRRHNNGANVLFVDGHSEWRQEKPQTKWAAWAATRSFQANRRDRLAVRPDHPELVGGMRRRALRALRVRALR